ncbi:cell division protein FtsZ [Lentilactobacillus kosonis]|uniref:Cell division protein FtsZ n=1 Tax=Lentilactobacillus kosonis TaxID=2810561 RepID=A0A401FNX2_9LACO|nr:cell division protein FtsZ [Lentilactobacillus kosonis]
MTDRDVNAATDRQVNEDPLGNWDIRNQPSSSRSDTSDNSQFNNVEKRDFDPFQADTPADDQINDNGDSDDDVPPFLKHRRNR